MIIPKNNLKQKKELILIFFVIVATFFLFQPRVSVVFFPIKQHFMLNNFVKTVEQSQSLDLQNYWEFREFYSQICH